MDSFMTNQGLLLKEFKQFVSVQSERVKQHARAVAEKNGRPYIHLNGEIRKEEKARGIAASDGIPQGLICILAAVEACQSFNLVPGEKRPRLVSARRKGLCLYFYFIDLFAAVLRGEHTIMGFRNRDILRQLFSHIKAPSTLRRLGARVSRLLKLLHIHQLIAKIPRSRRWRVTLKGQSIMSVVLPEFTYEPSTLTYKKHLRIMQRSSCLRL
jgi:hypothetical protein